MNIITFTKMIKYPDFRHDIIDFFSHNAALYTSMKNNTSNISIDAIRSNDGSSMTYKIEVESDVSIDELEKLFDHPITIFGETHIATTNKTDKGLDVIFRTTAE